MAAAVVAVAPRPAPVRNRAQYGDSDNLDGGQAHAYQTVRQMWHQVGGYFGPAAKLPPVSLDQPVTPGAWAETFALGAPGMAAGHPGRAGSVSISKAMQAPLTDQQNPDRDYALGLVVHELAHAFQSPDTFRRGRGVVEGGADAFSRSVSPSAIANALLGNSASTPPGAPTYTPMVDKVNNVLGPGWVQSGQFSRRG